MESRLREYQNRHLRPPFNTRQASMQKGRLSGDGLILFDSFWRSARGSGKKFSNEVCISAIYRILGDF